MNKADMDRKEKKRQTSDGDTAMAGLPLPTLEKTIDRFTDWATPFLTNEQRAQTRAALNSFLRPGGLGVLLQKKLLEYSDKNPDGSWLDNYWNSHFLAQRSPTPTRSNYFFLFRHRESSRLKSAAALVAAALNHKLLLDQQHVPLAVQRQTPVCESQMNNLFSTSRIAGESEDILQHGETKTGGDTSGPRHIVVFYRGNIHRLDLISKDGLAHSLRDIERGLEEICYKCLDEQATGRSIGHLTTLPRADWSRTRRALVEDSKNNAGSLHLIESALFSLHLEDFSPKDNLAACQQVFLGDSGNRWFDKGLQFIVFQNGQAGLNVEQSGLDRATIVDFLDYVLGIDPQSIDQYSGAVEQGIPFNRELVFDLPPDLQKKIVRTSGDYERRRNALVCKLVEFNVFDSALLVKKQISSDSFVQCALQLAHYRTTGKNAAVSQNISMRHFSAGRVQPMWTMSSQMKDFVDIMQLQEAAPSQKLAALKKAADQHARRVAECRSGDVPVLHLAELHNIYKRHPEDFKADFFTRLTSGGFNQQEINKALSLFRSPGWTCMKKQAFHTSFLASPNLLHQGFSPDCHGGRNISIGSILHKNALHAFLCTQKDNETALTTFMESWLTAMDDLRELLSGIR